MIFYFYNSFRTISNIDNRIMNIYFNLRCILLILNTFNLLQIHKHAIKLLFFVLIKHFEFNQK